MIPVDTYESRFRQVIREVKESDFFEVWPDLRAGVSSRGVSSGGRREWDFSLATGSSCFLDPPFGMFEDFSSETTRRFFLRSGDNRSLSASRDRDRSGEASSARMRLRVALESVAVSLCDNYTVIRKPSPRLL